MRFLAIILFVFSAFTAFADEKKYGSFILNKAPHPPILHTLIVKVNVLLGLWKIGAFGGLRKIPTKIILNV